MRKGIIGLLLFGLLVTVPWQQVFASNVAMISLVHCLVPIGWISDPERASNHTPQQSIPPVDCLDQNRQGSRNSQHLSQRLKLIAGDIAVHDEQWQVAITQYRAAAEIADHPVPGIWSAIVSIYMGKLKDYKTALTVALQAIRVSPRDQDLRVSAAMLYLYYIPPYSRYRESISVMRPELGFTHPYYYSIAAGAYFALGQMDDGLLMAQEAVRLSRATNDPNLTTGLYLLGFMQRCTGQPELGIANLHEAQGLSPQDKNIQIALSEDVTDLCKSYGKVK